MVQWCSSSYWWYPGMCEMSQPSWGGSPVGSPPHTRMTSSFQPLMQLLLVDDIGLSRLQSLFDLHVSVRFCKPFPMCRGHLGVFISHVLQNYCISPNDYSRHSMYVGFIILIFWLMFRPALVSLLHSVVFRVLYCVYYCLGGHRYASPTVFSTGTTSYTRDLLHL